MDLGLIIGLAVFFFLLGMVVAYLIFADQRKTSDKKETPDKDLPESYDMDDLVRIFQDRKTGKLVIETRQGRQEVGPGATGGNGGPISGQPGVPQADEIDISAQPGALGPMLGNQTQAPLPSNEQTLLVPGKGSLLRNPLAGLWKRRAPASANAGPMVLQIDQVLQENLSDSLMRRGLRLVQMPDQSMGITLDDTTYDSIDSVPDEEAQGLIRSAVAEWTKRQQPGSK